MHVQAGEDVCVYPCVCVCAMRAYIREGRYVSTGLQAGCVGLQAGCVGLQAGCVGLQAGCVRLQAGAVAMLSQLLLLGAKGRARDARGMAAVHWASSVGSTDLVKALLAAVPPHAALQPCACCLQPRASSLQPRACCLQPRACCLQPRASCLQPRACWPQSCESSLQLRASRARRSTHRVATRRQPRRWRRALPRPRRRAPSAVAAAASERAAGRLMLWSRVSRAAAPPWPAAAAAAAAAAAVGGAGQRRSRAAWQRRQRLRQRRRPRRQWRRRRRHGCVRSSWRLWAATRRCWSSCYRRGRRPTWRPTMAVA